MQAVDMHRPLWIHAGLTWFNRTESRARGKLSKKGIRQLPE